MIYRFGDHTLDTEGFRLSAGDDEIPVEPQVFALLQLLIENRHRVVSKDEIIEHVWDGRIVSDGTLNSRINSARRALGDDGKAQAVIKTFPRRGFRFVAAVTEDTATEAQPTPPSSATGKPSIAVLPFDNLSGDPEQEYFSDGIAEDIITSLSRLREITVLARNSSFSYKGQSPEIRQVSKELGARYVLEGSVRKAGKRVRIAAQLIDGETGNQLWAERYDSDLEDIFELQDDITGRVVATLEPELRKAEQERARLKRTSNLNAWDLFQRGMRHVHRRTKSDLLAANDLLGQAIALDHEFAQAHWGAALSRFYLVTFGWADEPRETVAEALHNATLAVELDPEDSMAHVALGHAFLANHQAADAMGPLKTAIEIDPNNVMAHRMLGSSLAWSGHASDSLAHLEEALRLSPRDPFVGGTLARLTEAHIFLGDFILAAELGEKAVRHRQAPQIWTVVGLASALGHLGRSEEARRACEQMREIEPGISCAWIDDKTHIQHQAYRDVYLDGLRKAGLPEN